MQLVDDRQRRRQPVQTRSVSGEDAQMPAEDVRLARVVAVAELELADDDVPVIEDAGEVRGSLVQDPRLLAARSGAVDRGALDADEVVERDRGEERCLPLAAREEGDELPLRAGGGRGDPPLERLEAEPDLLSEADELDAVA